MADLDQKTLDALRSSLEKLTGDSKKVDSLMNAFTKSGQAASEVSKLTTSLSKLDATRRRMLVTDRRTLVDLEKHRIATKALILATAERVKKEEELAASVEKGQEVSESELKSLERLIDVEKKQKDKLSEMRDAQEKYRATAAETYRTHSIWGKMLSGLESGVSKLASQLTVGSLATRSFNRYLDAAKLRGEILIKSFQGLDDMKFGDAASDVLNFDRALSKAQDTAAYFGVDVGEASKLMDQYSRIAGSQNPEALAKLSSATIAVSKSMNLSLGEAVEFVSNRMDKFGGTAESALLELNSLRAQTEKANKAFTDTAHKQKVLSKDLGMTVLKADDLTHIMVGLSRESSIYALNQNFVTQTLANTITKLQAQGESYQFAKESANDYMQALTTKAPDWMKILSGEKLLGEMQKAYSQGGAKGFVKEFGEDLDKSRPGLSKKVLAILKDPSLNQYAKTRLVQQLTEGSQTGLEHMNKQLLNFYRDTGGDITAIAQQMFGGDFVKAKAAVESAQMMEKTNRMMTDVSRLGADEISKKYGIAAEEAKKVAELGKKYSTAEEEATLRTNKEKMKVLEDRKLTNSDEYKGLVQQNNVLQQQMKEKKEALKDSLNVYQSQITAGQSAQNQAEMQKALTERQLEVQEKIKKIDAEMNSEHDETNRKILTERKKALETELESSKSKFQVDVEKKDSPLDKVMADLQKAQGNTAHLSLQYEKQILDTLDISKVATLGIASWLLGGKFAAAGKTAIQELLTKGGLGLGGGGGAAAGGAAEALAGTAAKAGAQSGFFGRIASFLKPAGAAAEGAAAGEAGAIASAASKLGVLGKAAGKLAGPAAGMAGLAISAPEVYGAYKSEGLKAATIKALPAVGATIGGYAGGAGGALLGGVGAVPGAIGGSIIGEKITTGVANWLKESPAAAAQAVLPSAAQAPMPMQSTLPQVTPQAAVSMSQSAQDAAAAPSAMTAGQNVANPMSRSSSGPTGSPTADLVGGVQADGSVMVKLNNFMGGFVSAQGMANSNKLYAR